MKKRKFRPRWRNQTHKNKFRKQKIVFSSDLKRNFFYVLSPTEMEEVAKLKKAFIKQNCALDNTLDETKEINI